VSTTTTPYGVIITETEDSISFRLPSWLADDERARIRSKCSRASCPVGVVIAPTGPRLRMMARSPNSRRLPVRLPAPPAVFFLESRSRPRRVGVDVTEEEDGLALDLWHPMRPGQDRRSFTAAEARAIAAELVRAAELVEAEGSPHLVRRPGNVRESGH